MYFRFEKACLNTLPFHRKCIYTYIQLRVQGACTALFCCIKFFSSEQLSMKTHHQGQGEKKKKEHLDQ